MRVYFILKPVDARVRVCVHVGVCGVALGLEHHRRPLFSAFNIAAAARLLTSRPEQFPESRGKNTQKRERGGERHRELGRERGRERREDGAEERKRGLTR